MAVARPIPELAPVTMAHFPTNLASVPPGVSMNVRPGFRTCSAYWITSRSGLVPALEQGTQRFLPHGRDAPVSVALGRIVVQRDTVFLVMR